MGGIGKGAWTEAEDKLLIESVTKHGARRWPKVAKEAGLNRCGKSCRLRWLNYLRPDIKRGNFSSDEEDLIIKLHKLLGNRWSLIAGRLPGRTDNEVKNYWNSTLAKRGNNKTQANPSTANHTNDVSRPPPSPEPEYFRNEADNALEYTVPSAIRTHAARCNKYFIDSHSDKIDERASKMDAPPTTDDHVSPNDSSDGGASSNSTAFYGHVENFLMEIDTDGDQIDLGPNFWSAMLDDWGEGDDELSLLGSMSPGINHGYKC